MELQKLKLEGAWKASLATNSDDRGEFREWFKGSEFENSLGLKFEVAQGNFSRSKKGVIRGVHFSTAEKGQGKWITCIGGSIWDVLVDLRPTSPTFKKWVGINITADEGTCVFVPMGFGHAFVSLEEDSTVVYLLSSEYSPEEEFGINPFDSDLNIDWPTGDLILSQKDKSAPNLKDIMNKLT